MTKRTKKSISQKVVGIGTSGMPAPVRKFLSNRIMAALVVVTVPVLFATGLLVVDWGNGIPTLSIDRHRASEAKAEATEKIKELSDNRDSGGFGKTPVKTFLTGGSDANSDGGWELGSSPSLDAAWQKTVGGIAEHLPGHSNSPPAESTQTLEWQKSEQNEHVGPLSAIKERFESRR